MRRCATRRISSASPSRWASPSCCAASRCMLFGKDPLSLPGFSGDGIFELFGAILADAEPVGVGRDGGAARRHVLVPQIHRHRPRGARLLDQPAGRAADGRQCRAADAAGVRGRRRHRRARRRRHHADRARQLGCRRWLTASRASSARSSAACARRSSPCSAGSASASSSRLAAGYISSGYKDAIVYGVLIAYLLVRGGVFLFGRAHACQWRGATHDEPRTMETNAGAGGIRAPSRSIRWSIPAAIRSASASSPARWRRARSASCCCSAMRISLRSGRPASCMVGGYASAILCVHYHWRSVRRAAGRRRARDAASPTSSAGRS